MMNKLKYLIMGVACLIFMIACSDDDKEAPPGNPVIENYTQLAEAYFGDNLPFTVKVSDNEVPLSTLTVKLFFGDEEVSKKEIRTKENGEYSESLIIPFFKDIDNGKATIEYTLRNTSMTEVKKSVEISLSRANYPYLILVTEDAHYEMLPSEEDYEYVVTKTFPSSKLYGYVKTPIMNDNGNEITFGWFNNAVEAGVTNYIPFSSSRGSNFSVTFSTLTFEASPFFEIIVNQSYMDMVDENNYKIDLELSPNDELTIEGLDLAEWWIDPDYFEKTDDNVLKFLRIEGKYRIIANLPFSWFRVEAMIGDELATAQPDGSGAVWLIGEGAGKPSLTNHIGWDKDNGLCLAPIGDKKYQMTLIAGQQIRVDWVNFKFYFQKGWEGGEFRGDDGSLTSTSDILCVMYDGNIQPFLDENGERIPLEDGATYVFQLDLSAGREHAFLSIVKK